MGTGEFNAGSNPTMYKHPIQGVVEILLVASRYRNWDKLRPDGPLGRYADFIFLPSILECKFQHELTIVKGINGEKFL